MRGSEKTSPRPTESGTRSRPSASCSKMPATASVGSSNEAIFWARLGPFSAILEVENGGVRGRAKVLKERDRSKGPVFSIETRVRTFINTHRILGASFGMGCERALAANLEVAK